MTRTTTPITAGSHWAGLALVLALGSGCSTAPPEPLTPPPQAVAPEKPVEVAPELPPPMPVSRWDDVFAQARTALRARDWMAAEQALAELPRELAGEDLARRDFLLARAAFLRGDLEGSRRWVAATRNAAAPEALRLERAAFSAEVAQLAGDWLASARTGAGILSEQAGDAALRRAVWADLNRAEESDLAAELSTTTDRDWRGWLELALLDRRAENRQALQEALQQWRNEYPAHAAAAPLPGGLEYLARGPASPTRVALLLPLSGRLAPAARAVQDGYLAHYFAAQARGEPPYALSFIDTTAFESATAAYRHAVAGGAEIVIGPLSKEAVTELGQLPERPVPVLALNRTDSDALQGGSALVQLSLAPEDDARRVAELAYGNGARRALVLRPAGERGARSEDVLRSRWQALGGSVVGTASYASAEAYSDNVKNALNLSASEQRASDIRSMLATNIEFTPRRRQDIDVIFLLADSPAEARSLKPLLAFHYAGNVPVYATSSIYSGVPDPRDRDLNGVRLTELPWLLGSNPGLRVAIAAGNTGSDNLARLNALGADAWLVQSRFAQLQAGADALLRGDTGLLRLDPSLRLQREPVLAVFDGSDLVRP